MISMRVTVNKEVRVCSGCLVGILTEVEDEKEHCGIELNSVLLPLTPL